MLRNWKKENLIVDFFSSALLCLGKKESIKLHFIVPELLSFLEATWDLSQLRAKKFLCKSKFHVAVKPQMVRIPSQHIPSHFPQSRFIFQVPNSQQHTKLSMSLNDVEVHLGKCLLMHIPPLSNINSARNTCSKVRKGQKHLSKHYYTHQGESVDNIPLCRDDWKWIVNIQRHDEEKEEKEWCTYCR